MKKLLFLFSGALVVSAVANEKPNILFIMSDDHTSQSIGVYGGRLAKLNPTPTIDSIAREGMIMQNAFCQNAICVPSRATIMTGQSSAVNGVTTLNGGLHESKHYLSMEMKKAGYTTAIIGKWHLGAGAKSFDYYKTFAGQGEYFDPGFYETGATGIVTRTIYGKTKTFKNMIQMKGHSSDCVADSALDWFKTKRDTSKPFFLKLHFKAPHDMFEYNPRYKSYLEDVEIPEPENLFGSPNHGSLATKGENGELMSQIGTSVGRRNFRRNYSNMKGSPWYKDLDQKLSNEEMQHQAYQEYIKAYLRCVKGVDDNLKRVIDYLKAEGLYDNTVIFYTGDQGFYLGEHDYIDKRWPYDESMRMPFIVRYPKSVKVGRSDAIVENIDYAPTLLDFAGVETPKYMNGKSFRSVLETGKEPDGWKQNAYYHYWMHMAHHDNPACIGIRTKDYKLILYYGTDFKDATEPTTPPAWELYDLRKDPTEDNNVYDNPEYAAVIPELKEMLKKRRAELGEDDPKFAFNQVIEEFWDYDEADRAKAVEIARNLAKSKKK